MKQIGAGCGGTVKLARRKADNKLYALKELELPRDPQEAAAVLQETHILASLDHPFIVRYYDCFVESQKLFMVMEYAPNGTLANVIAAHQKSNRHVDEAKLWGYCVQLLVALHAIHKIGIIHRDVKPHNIFLGEGDVIKVCTRVARTPPVAPHAHRTRTTRTYVARARHVHVHHSLRWVTLESPSCWAAAASSPRPSSARRATWRPSCAAASRTTPRRTSGPSA